MDENYSVKKALIFIIVIVVVLGLFYGLTILITDNKKSEPLNNQSETVIQYDEILIGNIYNQSENEYYVLATLSKDEKATNYISNFQSYASINGSLKTYTINLDSGFNKKYVSDQSDFTRELPIFKTSTLIKISDKKIVEVYEDEDITEILNDLIETKE